MRRKLWTMVLALALVLTMAPQMAFADNQGGTGSSHKAKRTILLYDCGTDLENGGGLATYNLRQILRAKFSEDEDIRFLVMTGGSDSWKLENEHLVFPDSVSVPEDAVSLSEGEGRGDAGPYADPKSQISNVYNQIWEAYGADAPDKKKAGKMVLLDGDGVLGDGNTAKRSRISASSYTREVDGWVGFDYSESDKYEWMNDPEVLKAFINYGVKNAPAEKYDLILWDHGGGPTSGFCNNMQEPSTGYNTMTVDKIMEALEENNVTNMGDADPNNDGRFEFVDFDACLMNSVEIDLALADYMDYYIASPETEPGYGQDYEGWLNLLGEDPDVPVYDSDPQNPSLARKLIDDFIAFYENPKSDGHGQNGTLAVIDMKKLMTKKVNGESFVHALTVLSESLATDLKNEHYYDEFRSFKSSIRYGGLEYYDLGNLLSQLAYTFDDADFDVGDTNLYTEIAEILMEFLEDPEIMYARGTEDIHTKAQYYRTKDGTMKFGEQGTSGMYIGFNPKEDPTDSLLTYHEAINSVTRKIEQKHPDRAAFFKAYRKTLATYGLAYYTGKAVSDLVAGGMDPKDIDYDAVKEYWQTFESAYGINQWKNVENHFGSYENIGTGWLEGLINARMRYEAIQKDKVRVQATETRTGTSYSITIDDIRKQAVDNIRMNLIAELPAAEKYLKAHAGYEGLSSELIIGTKDASEVYEVDPQKDGYEKAVEWSVSLGSKWTLDSPEKKWYALQDAGGGLHVTAAEVYLDEGEIDVPTGYWTIEERPATDVYGQPVLDGQGNPTYERVEVCHQVYLVYKRDKKGAWELTHIVEKQETGGWRFIPVDEYTGKQEVTPYVEVNNGWSTYYVPCSETSFTLSAKTKDKIRLKYMDVSKLSDIADTDNDKEALHSSVTATNLYGCSVDITDKVNHPSETALTSIELARVKAGLYTGKELQPQVVCGDKALQEGKDYKLTKLNTSDVFKDSGSYRIRLDGMGAYTGTADFTFLIADPETALADAQASMQAAQEAVDALTENTTADEIRDAMALFTAAQQKLADAQDLAQQAQELHATETQAAQQKALEELSKQNTDMEKKLADLTRKMAAAQATAQEAKTAASQSVTENTMKAKGKTVKVRYKKLKKKDQVIKRAKAIKIKKAKGKVTYKLVSVKKVKARKNYNKKFKVDTGNGNITVRKGLKKGTYKVKVKVKAAGNKKYAAATRTVTVTVKVN